MSKPFEDVATRHARLKSLHVGILVFPGVEVLDFSGPFEGFSVASRVSRRDLGIEQPFKVSLIGASRDNIEARHGMGILPHCGFNDAPAVDLLIVPGGLMGQPLGCEVTQAWVKRVSDDAALTASICTGAFLLGKLGILEGLPVTTHWEDIADLRAEFPQLDVKEETPFVDASRVVTSAGISAGISMMLALGRARTGRQDGHRYRAPDGIQVGALHPGALKGFRSALHQANCAHGCLPVHTPIAPAIGFLARRRSGSAFSIAISA